MLNNIKTIFTSKLFYILVALIFIVPFLYEKLPIRIDITQQSSLPQKIWLTYSDLAVESEYILFISPKTKYTLDSNIEYLKKISCNEDDLLVVDENRDYFCNDKYIGTASKYDGNKNLIENFVFSGIIPKNKYFVTGTHPLSHDSKYFGFVDKSQILRKAIPIERIIYDFK